MGRAARSAARSCCSQMPCGVGGFRRHADVAVQADDVPGSRGRRHQAVPAAAAAWLLVGDAVGEVPVPEVARAVGQLLVLVVADRRRSFSGVRPVDRVVEVHELVRHAALVDVAQIHEHVRVPGVDHGWPQSWVCGEPDGPSPSAATVNGVVWLKIGSRPLFWIGEGKLPGTAFEISTGTFAEIGDAVELDVGGQRLRSRRGVLVLRRTPRPGVGAVPLHPRRVEYSCVSV